MIRRLTAVAAPVVLLAGVVSALTYDDGGDPGPAQGRVEVLDGAVAVTAADGTERRIDDEGVVDFGDTVAVVEGSAVLELADGATYELRAHAGEASTVEVGSAPRVLAGQVLVADGFPARIGVGGATLSARGPLKVDAAAEVASSYAGGATVAGAGDATELRALRQLVLVPGAAPEPVAFDGTDPWDRRFLGEAIAFGERLEALARGYTTDLPAGGGRTVEFFRSVLPALAAERELGADLLDPSRSPGETLVGAAIVVQGRRGTFRERWADVFAFRDAGAAWGLVALDQGVSSAPVLETIELAIDASSSSAATGPASTGGPARPGASTPPSAGGPASPPPTGSPAPTDPAPAPEPEPDPSDGLLDPTTDPASELVQDLLEGMLAGG